MPEEPFKVKVDPASELARVLAAAAGAPVHLDVDGVPYRVTPEQERDLWTGYDPEWGGVAEQWQRSRASTKARPRDTRDPEASD